MVQLSHQHMITGKTIALTIWTLTSKVISLLFNMLSRLVIAFLPRSKHLLISRLHSQFAVILEPKKIKSLTASTSSPFVSHAMMAPNAMILVFWVLVSSQLFQSPLSLSRGFLVPLHYLPLEWNDLDIWGRWYFSQQSWFQLVIHPAQHFMMYSAYKLNKQGDNIQPCHNSFPDFELFSCSMSVSNCCFLTYIQVSQETGKVGYSPSF